MTNRDPQWGDLDENQQINLAGKLVQTLKHGEIEIRQDSVVGKKCLIIYRAGKAISTVWSTDDLARVVRKFSPEAADDLMNVMYTVKQLGGSQDDIQSALGAYFRNME